MKTNLRGTRAKEAKPQASFDAWWNNRSRKGLDLPDPLTIYRAGFQAGRRTERRRLAGE